MRPFPVFIPTVLALGSAFLPVLGASSSSDAPSTSSSVSSSSVDDAVRYLQETLQDLNNLEDLQEYLSQIEQLENDHAKVQSESESVDMLVNEINQRQLHAIVRKLTEIESLELARREAEASLDPSAEYGSNAAISIRVTTERLEQLLDVESILRDSDAEIESWITSAMEDQIQTLIEPLETVDNNTHVVSSEYEVSSDKCVKPDVVAQQVQQAVVRYSKDGIGIVDHAQAGTIVHERTSDTYQPALGLDQTLGSMWWTRYIPEDWEKFLPLGWQDRSSVVPLTVSHSFGGRIKSDVASPEAILDGSTLPGACWPMKGTSGRVTVRLPYPVQVTAISIEHASTKLLPKELVTSAPKKINVYGYPVCNVGCQGLGFDLQRKSLLRSFQYDIERAGVQTFAVAPAPLFPEAECGSAAPTAVEDDHPPTGSCSAPPVVESSVGIEVEVMENWGKSDYTCLYRFRVHGDAAVDDR